MAAEQAAMAIALKASVAADFDGRKLLDSCELFVNGMGDLFHLLGIVRVILTGGLDENAAENSINLFRAEVPARDAGREGQVQGPADFQQVRLGRPLPGFQKEAQEFEHVPVDSVVRGMRSPHG